MARRLNRAAFPASARYQQRIKFLGTHASYDASGTFPTPIGGDDLNIFIAGDGTTSGGLQLWIMDGDTWVLVGGAGVAGSGGSVNWATGAWQ